MKVVIWANCQGKVLFESLQQHMDVQYYVNYDYMHRKIAPPDQIKTCDVFIYQTYAGHKDSVWDIEVILESLKDGCKLISFPFVTFDGYFFPESVWNVKKKDLQCGTHPFGLWSSLSFKNEDFDFLLSQRTKPLIDRVELVENLTDKICSSDYVSSIDILTNLDDCLIKLETREKETTIKGFSNLIRQNYQTTRMFHHSVHPAKDILQRIIDEVGQALGINLTYDLDTLENSQRDYSAPIHPKVEAILNLQFQTHPVHKTYVNLKTYRDIVTAQVRDFLIPEECICTSCGKNYKLTF